jgi:hypothetical protein
MLAWLRGVMSRRCAICRVQIEGQALRRGLRRFCSPAHLQRHEDAEEMAIKELRLRRMMHTWRGGGCC